MPLKKPYICSPIAYFSYKRNNKTSIELYGWLVGFDNRLQTIKNVYICAIRKIK